MRALPFENAQATNILSVTNTNQELRSRCARAAGRPVTLAAHSKVRVRTFHRQSLATRVFHPESRRIPQGTSSKWGGSKERTNEATGSHVKREEFMRPWPCRHGATVGEPKPSEALVVPISRTPSVSPNFLRFRTYLFARWSLSWN